MPCPNHILCGNEDESDKVCYICDNSSFGYFGKYRNIHYSYTVPNSEELEEQVVPENKYRLVGEKREELITLLESRGEETGILKIEKINNDCPICLEEKLDHFVTHPTCCIHKLCIGCFKNTFMDGTIEYNPPEKPASFEEYTTICDELEEEGIYENWETLPEPKEEWSEEKKRVYREGVRYDLLDLEHMRREENERQEKSNLRACPVCRKTILKI